jgi:hypothetical protein
MWWSSCRSNGWTYLQERWEVILYLPQTPGADMRILCKLKCTLSGEGKLIIRNGQMKILVEMLRLDLVDLDLLVHIVTMMINPPSELGLL